METNNLRNSNSMQSKFTSQSKENNFRSLNIFIIDSQKEFFTNEINSLVPNSILFKEEANENSNNINIKISKYFFEKTENRYNVINLIHLDPFNSNFNFSSNKNFPMEDNFFVFNIPEYFISESEVIDIFSAIFPQEIFKAIIFKEIAFFLEEKKNKNFPFDDYFNVNKDKICDRKNFEIFKKKLQEMNLSKLSIMLMIIFY